MIEITVWIGTSCHLNGSEDVIRTFKKLNKSNRLEKKINLKGTFCMGKCSSKNIRVSIGNDIFETSVEDAESFFIKNIAAAV